MNVSLPARTRSELVADQAARPPFGSRTFGDGDGPVRVGITGTGPSLLLLPWSESDLARERAAGARVFGRLGIHAKMRVANALPGALATPGALIVGDVDEELGALDVPLGEIETAGAAAAAWELLDRVGVNVLVLDPATASTLLESAPRQPRPWWQGIVWLRRPGGSAARPTVGDFGGWQRTWLAVAEASSFVGGQCAQGGLHVEAVFSPAIEQGELVLGPLHPSVGWRYRTELAARAAGPCSCGSADPAFDLH